MQKFEFIKIFAMGAVGFLISFLIAPALINFLYKNKCWKIKARTKSIDGKELTVINKFHSEKEVNVPRMGGILIWGTTLFLSFLFLWLSKINIISWGEKINFLTREQTWLPLFALIVASLIGLFDDVLQIYLPKSKFLKNIWKKFGKYTGGGLSLKYRIISLSLLGLLGGWWFFIKLGWSTIHIPIVGSVYFGIFYIPFFIFVMLATYSGGVIDGLDGLFGGVFVSIFGALIIIAMARQQFDLASLISLILGTLLAFLWFNIPPARFYMGETGTIGLCAVLTVIAFLTDSVFVLPIIAFPLILASGSVVIQLLSKKITGKKVFLATPIHHHFEGKGWPHYKITMRFWIIGIISAIVGVTIKLLG